MAVWQYTTATYALSDTDYAVRRFGTCGTITFPDASTCVGRVYIIINSNGTASNVTLTPSGAQIVYDDVTNTTYTSLVPNKRLTVQSDDTNWIVIGQ